MTKIEKPESTPDAAGYYARPLCPFGSAPFSDDMIYVSDDSFSVSSDPEPPDIQIEIERDSCDRVTYRKGGLSE